MTSDDLIKHIHEIVLAHCEANMAKTIPGHITPQELDAMGRGVAASVTNLEADAIRAWTLAQGVEHGWRECWAVVWDAGDGQAPCVETLRHTYGLARETADEYERMANPTKGHYVVLPGLYQITGGGT